MQKLPPTMVHLLALAVSHFCVLISPVGAPLFMMRLLVCNKPLLIFNNATTNTEISHEMITMLTHVFSRRYAHHHAMVIVFLASALWGVLWITNALCRNIWCERFMGGQACSIYCRNCYVPICHQRLYRLIGDTGSLLVLPVG